MSSATSAWTWAGAARTVARASRNEGPIVSAVAVRQISSSSRRSFADWGEEGDGKRYTGCLEGGGRRGDPHRPGTAPS